MLQRYKEVFYGLLFGLGASVIDVFMHASMEQQGFWMELIHRSRLWWPIVYSSSPLDWL
jgi:hypothetical protein